MLELIKIKIENLASIENQTYYFNNELSTIIGINKDTSNIDKNISIKELLNIPLINLKSNGSGKTSIIEALHICLLGNCIKEKVNTRQLIREGKDFLNLELVCKNTQIGLEQIRIIRKIYRSINKTAEIRIFETKNGEEIEVPKTTADGMDTYILKTYIGLSKEDIDNFFIIQRDKFKSFLLLPDHKKKEILSRFTGISDFSFIEDSLSEEIKQYNQDKIEVDKNIAEIEGKISSYQDVINNSTDEKSFKEDKKRRISDLENNKEDQELAIINNKSTINLHNKLIERAKVRLEFWNKRKQKYEDYITSNNSQEEIEKLNKDRKQIEGEKLEINEAINEANNIKKKKDISINKIEVLKSKLNTLLSNLIECPNCKFRFNPSDNKSEIDIKNDIENQNKNKQEIEKELKEVQSDIDELNNLLAQKDKELIGIDTKISLIRSRKGRIVAIGDWIYSEIHKIEEEIKKFKRAIESCNNTISYAENTIEIINKKIESINKEEYTSIITNINKYKQYIIDLDKEKKELQDCKIEIDKQIQLSKDSLLNYNLFKNYLFNKIINEIEYIVNSYLQNFSDLTVQIKGSKVLADGKSIRDEINCIITRNSKEISYFLLSSGEKTFIDVSFILAFQKILNITSNNGFNFLILDEITGTIDCSNQEDLLSAINKLKKPILFITHIPTISDFRTTYIIKENDSSIIIQ